MRWRRQREAERSPEPRPVTDFDGQVDVVAAAASRCQEELHELFRIADIAGKGEDVKNKIRNKYRAFGHQRRDVLELKEGQGA